MFYTENKQLLDLVKLLQVQLSGEKDVLKQISKIRGVLLEFATGFKNTELKLSLEGKKMKKIPIYEGEDFTAQFFLWETGVRSVKHSHFGDWGNILVLDGQILLKEFVFQNIDYLSESFEISKKNQILFDAGQVFSLLQNCNALHSMANPGSNTALTLHIYRKKQEGNYFTVKKGRLICK